MRNSSFSWKGTPQKKDVTGGWNISPRGGLLSNGLPKRRCCWRTCTRVSALREKNLEHLELAFRHVGRKAVLRRGIEGRDRGAEKGAHENDQDFLRPPFLLFFFLRPVRGANGRNGYVAENRRDDIGRRSWFWRK